MTDAPLRLGLVGCGRLAELGYAPAAAAARGVEIVAVADPDRDRRGLLAGKLRASGHVSSDESVVLFNTGTGYKYVDNMLPSWDQPAPPRA